MANVENKSRYINFDAIFEGTQFENNYWDD